MKTERFERACCWPINSVRRCGRSVLSAPSSSRRSAVTSRGGELNASSQCALPAVFVRQEIRDRCYCRTVCTRHDHASIAIIVPDQLAAAPAGGHDDDGLV